MFYRNILNMLNLRFKDPDQEKEYLSLKIPLLQTFFTYLLASVVVLLIPLSIHFFFIIDYPKQGIMAIVMLFIAVLIFFLRKPLGRWMEYLVLGYLLAVVGLVVFNLYFIIATLNFCEAFYSGYAFALLHRILGYRVVQLHSMLIFHLASLLLRLTIFVKHGIPISLMITALEVLTVCLSVQSERGERSLFDSLYKSKKQLEKFKDFLTEHLPSPMSIFPQDHSTAYFINDSFKRTLGCEDKSQAKDALRTLVLDQESLEKNSELFEKMRSFISSTGQTLRLSKVLGLLSKSSALIRGTTTLTFQVREDDTNVEASEVFSNKSEEDFLKDSDTPTIRRGGKKNKTNGTGISLTPRENSDGDKDGKDIEANAPVKDVRRRIFQVKVFLLPWDGSEAMAVILDDVTQQRTIMELKIADKNKDLVIAMVSHELRTPLNGMLGLMDILKKIVGNDAQSYLAACRNSGLFLLNLVNSILDMSQIRNNKLKLFHSEIILLDLLNEVKSLFESFCSTKSVYLRLNVGKNVPKTIFTDRNRLSQILINLLGNAFKFTFEGGITLSVDLEGKDSNRIRFSIQDTGLGIKKEDQEKLFKLFGRLEQQDGRINTNGVGLGLTISNNLAILLDTPMNDGCQRGIHVESELGRGSTFYFIIESRTQGLECASPDDVSIYDVQPPTEELRLSPKMTRYSTIQALNFGKMRGMQTSIGTPNDNDTLSCKDPYMALGLKMENRGKSLEDVCSNRKEVKDRERNEKPWCLIVDDNPFNIIVASHLLGDGGYQLKKAMNGQEAIQEVKKHAQEKLEPFKVVLMDCQMPVMDGYQATKILKEMIKKGEVPQFPILALSSNNRDEDHEKLCTEVGMDGSVTKPLKVEELEDAIKKLNKKKGQEGAS